MDDVIILADYPIDLYEISPWRAIDISCQRTGEAKKKWRIEKNTLTLTLRNVLIIYGWVTVSVLWSAMLCEKMELELQTVTVDGIIHENDRKD